VPHFNKKKPSLVSDKVPTGQQQKFEKDVKGVIEKAFSPSKLDRVQSNAERPGNLINAIPEMTPSTNARNQMAKKVGNP
jgi:hypothetical protein